MLLPFVVCPILLQKFFPCSRGEYIHSISRGENIHMLSCHFPWLRVLQAVEIQVLLTKEVTISTCPSWFSSGSYNSRTEMVEWKQTCSLLTTGSIYMKIMWSATAEKLGKLPLVLSTRSVVSERWKVDLLDPAIQLMRQSLYAPVSWLWWSWVAGVTEQPSHHLPVLMQWHKPLSQRSNK